MLLALLEGLDAPLNERNEALVAAGFAPLFGSRPIDHREMDTINEVIDLMLTAQHAAPAMVLDSEWNLVKFNASFVRLLQLLEFDLAALQATPNVLLALTAPGGLATRLLNPAEVLGDVLKRAQREALHVPALQAMLAQIPQSMFDTKQPQNFNNPTLNVRNFEWRTETDYTPRWETREYDLSQLQTADLVLSYWMGPKIAHTLVSFGFADGQYLTFSLEIRKEVGEEFSAWKGFFRQYEAILVAADEADIIRTRSNARGENVYIYRLAISPEQLRTLFLAYVEQAQKLEKTPEFYNTLTSNCTTVVFDIAKRIVPDLPLDYRLLLSGYFAEYAHAQG
eukprot:gene15030-14829_t